MLSHPASLVDHENLRPRVEARLAEVLEDASGLLSSISDDTGPLLDAWRQILGGGKRLRAALCYWSWRTHGGAADDDAARSVIGVGAALELFQAAALFHDDVMDNSDTRRGLPTAHRVFARRHRDNGWSGDDIQFGLSSAILLGDLSLIASEAEFVDATRSVAPGIAHDARAVFTRMRSEVTVGQYLDMRAQVVPWSADLADDERRAREVIRSKSARYSVECPMVLGAVLAGASADEVAIVSEAGLPLGEAFQLRDDLLGVFGDPAQTGKPSGDDLREGKRTVLMVWTMRALAPDARTAFAADLGRSDLTDADIARLQDTVRNSGAVEEIERLIESLTDEAFGALDRARLEPSAAVTLREIARAVVQRAA